VSVVAAQYIALSRRSIMNTARQPIAIVPAFAFPLLFLALNAAALAESIHLPAFPPVDSFLQFMVATTIIQGGLFGAIAAGADMARDIEGGFFDRIVATPVSRTSILVGRVAGSFTLAFIQAFVFFAVATLFGLEVEGGVLGMFGVASISSVAGAGVGAVAVAIGIKSGNTEVVQGSFPLIFVSLFLSSAFFPRSLMNGWFKSAATINPLSHMIEAARSLVIRGWDSSEFGLGLLIALVILGLGLALSLLALRSRLADKA
jgi:ABC-2 type transport system permease protein